jgi:hypothetical protein
LKQLLQTYLAPYLFHYALGPVVTVVNRVLKKLPLPVEKAEVHCPSVNPHSLH